MTVILGAGLAGLSSSFHLEHKCTIFEKKSHVGGHIHSQEINEFTWDEGPHVSFTKHDYVKNLFAQSCEYHEFPVYPTNFYKGQWVPHPAQTNLYALPEPIRTECLNSFIASRANNGETQQATNYQQWLRLAFGQTFADEFPAKYTLKYWTTDAENLTTDWVGERVFQPNIDEVKAGFIGPQQESKHYITSVRYPKKGGYFSYANTLKDGANVQLNQEVVKIDLHAKQLFLKDGSTCAYSTLINTMPLPEFVKKCNAPSEVLQAAENLACSQLLLINIVANHPAPIHNQWLYVYDTEMYSTRINFTELLAASNGVPGKCGIQVEVYFSNYRKQTESLATIIARVCNELIEMKLVKDASFIHEVNTQFVNYANVIFDHHRRASLNTIYAYLEQFGLKREDDDLEAMTDWEKKMSSNAR